MTDYLLYEHDDGRDMVAPADAMLTDPGWHRVGPVTVAAAEVKSEPMATFDIGPALRRAYSLGQTYWQQADSDYTSQHRKSEVTAQKFQDMIAETQAALAKGQP